MDKKKIIALPLIAIMLSLTTAVAVAHWVDNLYVEGTVQTGYLCTCFRPGAEGSLHGTGWDWTCGVGFVNTHQITPVKDIADTYVTIIDCHTLNVTIDNGYPCYYDHIVLGIDNCGTVPWSILTVTFTSTSDSVVITHNGYLTLDLDGVGDDDLEINWGDSFGVQIDPGEYADLSFDIHLMNPIPQDSQLTFTVTIEVVNWNEYSTQLALID
jgi:hypothetical protein